MTEPKTLGQLFDFSKKTIVVTGAAVGIGRATALRFAEAGARVVVVDLDEALAQQTAALIRQRGGDALVVQANVASVEDASRVMAEAVALFDSVDVLVNNAGVFPFSPALDTPEALWDRVLDINLKGAFFFAQAAARAMARSGGGSIVNIASVDAIHPTGALAHYDASKGGLVMLTRSLALEWGPLGIRVNTVAPGSISTPGAAAVSAASKTTEEQLASFSKRIPLGRTGDPDEIATATLCLASPAMSYVTGATLVVDGGYLLG